MSRSERAELQDPVVSRPLKETCPSAGSPNPTPLQALPIAVFSIWRWVLLHLVRSPLVGGVNLLLLGMILLFTRLQTLPSPEGPLEGALVWTHPAALFGVSLALVVLSEGAPFLVRVDPRTRYWGELGASLLAALYLQLPILLGALLSGVAPADLGWFGPA